ncbi:serine/threonine-protein phosphatase 2A regulatory subunit B'' subunit beta-like [Ornithodoros turicata]|uniref:serine/threonine-protein phosphatase 2A regulatory subunit B'' subunit beta-like n=1 Tax=Ornithodoros turicata TaxID=34597 RepID=UPI003139CB2F
MSRDTFFLADAPPRSGEGEARRVRCYRRCNPAPWMSDPPGDAGERPGDGSSSKASLPSLSLHTSSSSANAETESDLVASVSAELQRTGRQILGRHDFRNIVKLCGLPLYLKYPFFQNVVKNPTRQAVLDFCRRLQRHCGSDRLAKTVYVLTRGRKSYVEPSDLHDMIQDLIDTHSGLTFLRQVSRSHSVFIDTVIGRLYFELGRSWSWRLGLAELRRTDFLDQLDALELHSDFMNVEGAFSYKDAYVIHAIFNNLDRDNDRLLSKADVGKYEKGALVPRAVERVFDLLGCPAMRYVDFVVFLLAEKDKAHPRSIEYWFSRLDLDGDGVLTMYELEAFFEEQHGRCSLLMTDLVSFQDVFRQMIDLVKPKSSNMFTLSDLKRCSLASVFFNTFINTYEFIHHEVFDPFDADRLRNGSTQWEHFATKKFGMLMAEGDKEDSSEDELV